MTRTATKTKTDAPQEASQANLPAEHVIHRPRLPLRQEVADRFGLNPVQWNALVNSIYPTAKSIDAVVMVLSYCKARNLDVFKRPVHIVPMWNSKVGESGGYVDTVWPGIAELRTTAFRTSQYAGCDEAQFGPDLEETFTGTTGKGDYKKQISVTVTFPEWCRITVYRLVGNHRVPFVGPKVYWRETYARIGKTDVPNDMWAKRARGQLEKCAEAAALRKAFPEELGNMLSAEEMEGKEYDQTPEVIEHSPKTAAEPEQQPKRASKLEAFGAANDAEDAEFTDEPAEKKAAAPASSGEAGLFYDEAKSLEQLNALKEDLAGPLDASDLVDCAETWGVLVPLMTPAHQAEAAAALEARAKEIMGSKGKFPSFKKAQGDQ